MVNLDIDTETRGWLSAPSCISQPSWLGPNGVPVSQIDEWVVNYSIGIGASKVGKVESVMCSLGRVNRDAPTASCPGAWPWRGRALKAIIHVDYNAALWCCQVASFSPQGLPNFQFSRNVLRVLLPAFYLQAKSWGFPLPPSKSAWASLYLKGKARSRGRAGARGWVRHFGVACLTVFAFCVGLSFMKISVSSHTFAAVFVCVAEYIKSMLCALYTHTHRDTRGA